MIFLFEIFPGSRSTKCLIGYQFLLLYLEKWAFGNFYSIFLPRGNITGWNGFLITKIGVRPIFTQIYQATMFRPKITSFRGHFGEKSILSHFWALVRPLAQNIHLKVNYHGCPCKMYHFISHNRSSDHRDLQFSCNTLLNVKTLPIFERLGALKLNILTMEQRNSMKFCQLLKNCVNCLCSKGHPNMLTRSTVFGQFCVACMNYI